MRVDVESITQSSFLMQFKLINKKQPIFAALNLKLKLNLNILFLP